MPGEKDQSQKLHRELLKEESNKSSVARNKKLVTSLMNVTYRFRRTALNNNMHVKDLINLYPIFFDREVQLEEFKRLTAVDVPETMSKEISSYGANLLEMFLKKPSKLLKPQQDDVCKWIDEKKDSSIEDVCKPKSQLGIFVLPFLLKEPLKYFIEEVCLIYFFL